MNVTNLKSDIKEFTNILNIADVHIRLKSRHDEYVEVFTKLYAEIDKTPIETVITFSGDLFHNKSDMSAEGVYCASEFLKNLANRRTTIVISGNHDVNLMNSGKMGGIYPIINALNHPNLHYLQFTGLYKLGNILFNCFSVFDERSPENYILHNKIPKIYTNAAKYCIALYHGAVDGATNDYGFKINSKHITNATFDGHDIVLLGDIHKYQVLQEYNYENSRPSIVYPGSLIMQNHGETIENHGFLYYDLKTKKHEHGSIKNDHGFFTIDMVDGKVINDISNIPKNVKLRIRTQNTNKSEIDIVLNQLRNKVEIVELASEKFREDFIARPSNSTLNIGKLSTVEYQNELMEEYLRVTFKIEDKSIVESIKEINKHYNLEVDQDKFAKNIVWTPKKFEFSNMFSYGENNVVDFSKMDGIIGLFGRNGSGKSAILASLLFCLFDKCPSTSKAAEIMNSEKSRFSCKFNFSIENVDYFIERIGKKDKNGKVAVTVDFWKQVDGNIVELNGELRNSTNNIIRSYIGTYDDFVMTSFFSNANREGNYIDLGPTEKKDLLARFMGVLIFDQLNEKSNKKYLELSAISKKYESKNYTLEIQTINQHIEDTIKSVAENQYESTNANTNIQNLNSELLEFTTKLHNIIASEVLDVPAQESKKSVILNDINKSKLNIVALKNSLSPLIVSIENLEKEIKDTPHIQINVENYKELKDKLVKLNLRLENKKTIVLQKKEKLATLEEHKFDPNCEFCINNVFVKDAIATKTSIEIEKSEARNLIAERSEVEEEISIIEPEIEKNNVLNTKKNNLVSLYTNKNSIENSILKSENDINKLENTIKDIDLRIKSFKENEDKIRENTEINVKINDIKRRIDDCNKIIRIVNSEIIKESSILSEQKTRLEYLKTDYDIALKTEKEKRLYEYYTQITSRNGLPYQLITKTIPIVESEINNILNQIVSFNVKFEYDDKNISAYFIKDGAKWAIETISGFEKFVCSLAIRIALINISCISRSNFISIDEGFDSVDSVNIASMNTLFQYLRSNFKHIIVITHTDSIKDAVDSTIDINQIDGFSHVNYD